MPAELVPPQGEPPQRKLPHVAASIPPCRTERKADDVFLTFLVFAVVVFECDAKAFFALFLGEGRTEDKAIACFFAFLIAVEVNVIVLLTIFFAFFVSAELIRLEAVSVL